MQPSIFAGLQWLDENSNPFGVRCLDVRSFARSMIATTQDPEIADRFLKLRGSTGQEHIGKLPLNPVTLPCSLAYPFTRQRKAGPVFSAREMEDKWDIYLHEEYLYFARSWTSELVFRAGVTFDGSQVTLNSIDSNAETGSTNATFVNGQVDFLVKSHLFKREVPHPLPADLPEDSQSIALYSFGRYGRSAAFATYADTTKIQLTW